jgi:hypothetical protein
LDATRDTVLPEALAGGYAFLRAKFRTGLAVPPRSRLARDSAVFSRRLPGQVSKDAIELRQGLKARGEGSLAHAHIEIVQKRSRFFVAGVRDVLHKIHPGDLLERLA